MTDAHRSHGPPRVLERDLLVGTVVPAARGLLGRLLWHDHPDGTSSVARIVETEAYAPEDPASHSHRGPTPRCASMFAEPGTAYVYRSYGVHACCNVSVGPEGYGAAILLRAAVVVSGGRRIRARRTPDRPGHALLRGPGNLTAGMGIEVAHHDGVDLLRTDAPLRLCRDDFVAREIVAGPRVGVAHSADLAWRFHLAGHPAVSRYRRSPRAPARGHTEGHQGR